MKKIMLLQFQNYPKGDFFERPFFFENVFIDWGVIILFLILIFWGLWSCINNIPERPKINAEIVFKQNEKATLSGDFEIWRDGYRYKHLETGAVFFGVDILYIKDTKILK